MGLDDERRWRAVPGADERRVSRGVAVQQVHGWRSHVGRARAGIAGRGRVDTIGDGLSGDAAEWKHVECASVTECGHAVPIWIGVRYWPRVHVGIRGRRGFAVVYLFDIRFG